MRNRESNKPYWRRINRLRSVIGDASGIKDVLEMTDSQLILSLEAHHVGLKAEIEDWKLGSSVEASEADKGRARVAELWTAYCEISEYAGSIVAEESASFDLEIHREVLEILDENRPIGHVAKLEREVTRLETRVAKLESELAKVQDADDQLIQRLIAAHKVGYEMGLESKSVDQSGDGEPLAKGIPEDDYRKALSKLGEEKSNGN